MLYAHCVEVSAEMHSDVSAVSACSHARAHVNLLSVPCWLPAQIGDRAQELAEACGGRPLAAHMVGTALASGTAQLEEVLQAVASPAVAHLHPLDRYTFPFPCATSGRLLFQFCLSAPRYSLLTLELWYGAHHVQCSSMCTGLCHFTVFLSIQYCMFTFQVAVLTRLRAAGLPSSRLHAHFISA